MGSQGKTGKGGHVLPNSAQVTVQTSAGMVRALLVALRGGQPVTAPVSEINSFIVALQAALDGNAGRAAAGAGAGAGGPRPAP